MAASNGNDPPPQRQYILTRLFRSARSLKKVGFFAETRLGAGPKTK